MGICSVDSKDDATCEKFHGCVMSRMDVLSAQVEQSSQLFNLREDRGAVGVGPLMVGAAERQTTNATIPSSTTSHHRERGGRHFSEFSSRNNPPASVRWPPAGGALCRVFEVNKVHINDKTGWSSGRRWSGTCERTRQQSENRELDATLCPGLVNVGGAG